MTLDAAALATRLEGTLSGLLGIRLVEATPERVVAELDHRAALTTVGGGFHGGTLMALADTLGAVATVLNLPAGTSTTTLESKTNFMAAARSGRIRAETTPLHRGRRTMVWQTRVTDAAGRLLSLTIQTQMVLASGQSDHARGDPGAPAGPDHELPDGLAGGP
jgi:1,4-dihydroxy-2-naphthoyl-CoA hydrolase